MCVFYFVYSVKLQRKCGIINNKHEDEGGKHDQGVVGCSEAGWAIARCAVNGSSLLRRCCGSNGRQGGGDACPARCDARGATRWRVRLGGALLVGARNRHSSIHTPLLALPRHPRYSPPHALASCSGHKINQSINQSNTTFVPHA
jgi:hypothetical protein